MVALGALRWRKGFLVALESTHESLAEPEEAGWAYQGNVSQAVLLSEGKSIGCVSIVHSITSRLLPLDFIKRLAQWGVQERD